MRRIGIGTDLGGGSTFRVLMATMAVCAVGALGIGPASAAATTTTKTVTLSATSEEFLDTGVDLANGATASITVTGDGTCHYGDTSSDCPGGPSGAGITCADNPFEPGDPAGPAGEEVPYGSVAGRIGSEGKPFFIGAAKTVTGPGELYVVYNDCAGHYGDNEGSFEVTITYTSESPALEAEEAAEAKEAKEKKEKEAAGKRKSAVEVTCTINVDGSKPSTCTAQVGDATGGSPVEVPTGSVKFSTTLGSFLGGDTCTLAHSSSGNTSFCVVEYAPPPGVSIIETELPIKAAYAGDSNFSPGEGAFKLKEMGIEAEEFEEKRINDESCTADDGTTADVDATTGDVTVSYTAPGPGTVETQIDSGAGGTAASASPDAASCTADITLALGGASASSYRAATSKAQGKAKKGKGKQTTIAKANVKVKHAGLLKLHIPLNRAGKKFLGQIKRKHEHAHVTLRLQFKK
jgi:hypothetical protein